LSVDVDTSVLVSLFVRDRNVAAADSIASRRRRWTYSTWTQTEYSAAIGALVRTGELTRGKADHVEQAFDGWCARNGDPAQVESIDIVAARRLVLDLSLKLRAPDALHIAVALRRGSGLATLDGGMAEAATRLGISVETG
jgi:predicted nucleic acid-binding protein